MTLISTARAAFAAVLMSAGAAVACGPGIDTPCAVAEGEYRILVPNAAQAPIPAVIFLHGYGGSGRGTLRNQRVVGPLLERGYAVIAPQGLPRGEDGPRSWSFRPGFGARDERAFFMSVVQDAADRFGVDPERVVLSGFSAGGFMVSYLACDAPETFAAYAPVSGGFWRPHPRSCAGPVRLLHTHGWADTTVPLEGRYLRDGAFQQGDIFAGMEIWRHANSCADEKPDGTKLDGDFLTRHWTDCASGSDLEFALFPGGHTVPEGWADMMLTWFEEVSG